MVFIGGAVLANIVSLNRNAGVIFKTDGDRCRTRKACGLARLNGKSRARVHWRSWAEDDVKTAETTTAAQIQAAAGTKVEAGIEIDIMSSPKQVPSRPAAESSDVRPEARGLGLAWVVVHVDGASKGYRSVCKAS